MRPVIYWHGKASRGYQIPMVIGEFLRYRWTFARYRTGGVDPRYSFGWCKWMPILWYSKNDGMPRPVPDLLIEPDGNHNSIHKWQKSILTTGRYIDAFGPVVTIDPFTGGGTVPAVCKMLGRRYLAFEIDPDTAELARKRVRQTQPPMTGWADAMQQLEMGL